jgi:hypothetical protein
VYRSTSLPQDEFALQIHVFVRVFTVLPFSGTPRIILRFARIS